MNFFKVLSLVSVVVLFGCQNFSKPEIEGYVMAIDDDQFLVTSMIGEGDSASKRAIWFSAKPADLEIGQKVKVWTNALDQSYPSKAIAEKCEIVENGKSAKAISEALKMTEFGDAQSIPFVSNIQFIVKEQTWKIKLESGSGEEMISKAVVVKLQEKKQVAKSK